MADTLKDLEQNVEDRKTGLRSADELKAFFDGVTGNTAPEQAPAAEPAPAPALVPTAPPEPAPVAEPTPAPPEPAKGEHNVMDLIPEQFRDKDVPTSLGKITKSYADLQAELTKQRDELANMNRLVKSVMEKEPQYVPQQPVATGPADDIEDSAFFENPKEAVSKMAARIAATQILAYHTAVQKQAYVDNFKAQNSDFENYREDIVAILRARPDLDKDERNLPLVFELAKQRKVQRLVEMKTQLGIQVPPSAPALDLETIKKEAYESAMKAITEGIAKRQAASGIQGGSTPVQPNTRVQPRVTEKPLTAEDSLMQELLNSGPKKLTLLGE